MLSKGVLSEGVLSPKQVCIPEGRYGIVKKILQEKKGKRDKDMAEVPIRQRRVESSKKMSFKRKLWLHSRIGGKWK